MIPGSSRNCLRTSVTTRAAALATALIARPEKKNTTAAPMIRPNSTFGSLTFRANAPRPPTTPSPTLACSVCTASP